MSEDADDDSKDSVTEDEQKEEEEEQQPPQFTNKRQRKDYARMLIKDRPDLSNAEIAEASGLTARSVSAMRLVMEGKLVLKDGKFVPKEPHTETPKPATAETRTDNGSIHSSLIEHANSFSVPDTTSYSVPPKPQREQIHSESALKDMDSRIREMDSRFTSTNARLDLILAKLQNGSTVVDSVPGQKIGNGEMTTETEFRTFDVKIKVDAYLMALFQQWKETRNIRAKMDGGTEYIKEFEEFTVDCIIDFFDQRGIDFAYNETKWMREYARQSRESRF